MIPGMKRTFQILFLTVVLCNQAFAHSGKPKYHVIIDTDGAVDDMRALSMLLSGNDIRVLAITCSRGSLMPGEVCTKVSALLAAFHHEGIPVGVSESAGTGLPAWADFARSIQWGHETDSRHLISPGNSLEVLNNTIEEYPDPVTLIALGSLETYAHWLKSHPEVSGKIDRIIWYSDHNITAEFNYQISPEAFDYIRESGVLLEIVSNNSDTRVIDQDYLNMIRNTRSVYANQIEYVHSQTPVINRIHDGHLSVWDDMVPLYLTLPILFEIRNEDNIRFASLVPNIPTSFIYESIGKLLSSAGHSNNRVFSAFPTDSVLYKPAYAIIINETIERFGLVEWKAICMTNEIHGHVGIYSIIGAKMGIRAMEFFNVGVNNLVVESFAGNNPPLSCLNDGIQISTGSTIGQGLITIADTVSSIPSATFEFNGQKIRISVNREIAEQLRKEIRFGVETYGLQSDPYWIYIEELAKKYWTDLNRQDIFTIKRM